MTIDARAIANFVLGEANRHDIPITNMAINKLVYFLHAEYLLRFDKPLISSKIEAWEHGPVIREVYNSFKTYNSAPIQKYAEKFNPITGEFSTIEHNLASNEEDFIKSIMPIYLTQSASQLRNESHVEGGPWDRVFNHEGNVNPGMEISNSVIIKYQKSRTRH